MILGNAATLYMNLIALREDDRSDLLVPALTVPVFWLMMSVAAAKGCYQLIRNPSYWEKTFHGLSARPDRGRPGAGRHVTPHGRVPDRRLKLAVYLVALGVYLVVGYWLQVRHGFILGDALSRVSAAQGVLFSRDPHLAAIGFIFTPLTAMVQIPAVCLEPAVAGDDRTRLLRHHHVGGVHGGRRGSDPRDGHRPRAAARATSSASPTLFALNPMIVFYGSNGMSEAPFIFFMSWAVRRLIMWMVDDDVHHLVAAGGIAMGLAYLTRYDAVACVAAAGMLVGATTYLRARPAPRFRRALLDTVVGQRPGLRGVRRLGGGQLADHRARRSPSSPPSTAMPASLRNRARPGSSFAEGLIFALVCVTLLAPTLVPIALWCGVRRYAPSELAGAAGAALAVRCGAGVPGLQLRLRVDLSVPAVLHRGDPVVGMPGHAGGAGRAPWCQPRGAADTHRRSRIRRRIDRAAGRRPVIWRWRPVLRRRHSGRRHGGCRSRNMRHRNTRWVRCWRRIPTTSRFARPPSTRIAASFSTERQIANYLEKLNLPESSVITDTVYGFAVTAASNQPRTFVVPSDPDFVTLLNDPENNGVRYLLAVPPTGRGISDALNVRYPTLYETGADIATLELEIPNDGDSQPTWRLYRVNESLTPH